jgi:hypothetical protein
MASAPPSPVRESYPIILMPHGSRAKTRGRMAGMILKEKAPFL